MKKTPKNRNRELYDYFMKLEFDALLKKLEDIETTARQNLKHPDPYIRECSRKILERMRSAVSQLRHTRFSAVFNVAKIFHLVNLSNQAVLYPHALDAKQLKARRLELSRIGSHRLIEETQIKVEIIQQIYADLQKGREKPMSQRQAAQQIEKILKQDSESEEPKYGWIDWPIPSLPTIRRYLKKK